MSTYSPSPLEADQSSLQTTQQYLPQSPRKARFAHFSGVGAPQAAFQAGAGTGKATDFAQCLCMQQSGMNGAASHSASPLAPSAPGSPGNLPANAIARMEDVPASPEEGTQQVQQKGSPAPFHPGLPLAPGQLATPPGRPIDPPAVPPGYPIEQPAIPPGRPSDPSAPSPFHEGKIPFATNNERSASSSSVSSGPSSDEEKPLAANSPLTAAFFHWQPRPAASATGWGLG